MAKQKFKITNWPTYNKALKQRGSLIVWLDKPATAAWTEKTSPERRGRPFHYTDVAITTVLIMKYVFSLYFMKMKWIFISIRKLVQTGSCAGSKSTLLRWVRMKNIIWRARGTVAQWHSGTGKVSYIGSNSKSSFLFISLLKHLKAKYCWAKTVMLVVDNYIIHKSRGTLCWLKANPKFRVIYQPVYSLWVNHVERLWQTLHDTITRNHQCRSMWQLLKKVWYFMKIASPFRPK